ncbi:MAG: hypothetical protein ACREEE_11205 [Dongiaceae bacterium]
MAEHQVPRSPGWATVIERAAQAVTEGEPCILSLPARRRVQLAQAEDSKPLPPHKPERDSQSHPMPLRSPVVPVPSWRQDPRANLINNGYGNAREIIQPALANAFDQAGIHNPRWLPSGGDTDIGPRTRTRLNMLIREGHGRTLRNALVDQRLEFIRNSKRKDLEGLYRRIGRFHEWERIKPPN